MSGDRGQRPPAPLAATRAGPQLDPDAGRARRDHWTPASANLATGASITPDSPSSLPTQLPNTRPAGPEAPERLAGARAAALPTGPSSTPAPQRRGGATERRTPRESRRAGPLIAAPKSAACGGGRTGGAGLRITAETSGPAHGPTGQESKIDRRRDVRRRPTKPFTSEQRRARLRPGRLRARWPSRPAPTRSRCPTAARWELFVALPEAGHGPGLLVLMEIFGVGSYIRRATERLAELGYVALAPDLYRRTEPGARARA